MAGLIQRIINDYNLYPQEFVESYGKKNKQWNLENEISRELSLRHDMVCVLLCNLELNANKRKAHETLFPGSSKKPRIDVEAEIASSHSSKERASSSQEDDDYMEIMESGEFSDLEEDSEDDVYAEEIYRFKLLEGNDISDRFTQNAVCNEWGLPILSSMWDIADYQVKKFIEVKVTRDAKLAFEKYCEKKMEIPDNSSLCIVNYTNMTIEWHDHPGGLIGESKVINFLLKRKEIFEQNRVQESSIFMEDCKEELVFCDQWFNDVLKQWRSYILQPTKSLDHSKPLDVPSLSRVGIEDLLNGLHDPTTRDAPIVSWKGKILPSVWTDPLTLQFKEDIEMIQSYISLIEEGEIVRDMTVEKDARLQLDQLHLLLKDLKEREDNFNYDVFRDDTRFHLLKEKLGFKQKKRTFDPSDNTTHQPEYKSPKERKYDYWFDALIDLLRADHHLKGRVFPQLLREESEPIHPMALCSQKLCTQVFEILSKSEIAVWLSQLINTYSRLGGVYMVNNQKSTIHSKHVIFPIYSTTIDKETQYRHVTGLCMRGRAHAKFSSDKINIMTIERLKKDLLTSKFLEFGLDKGFIFKTKSDLFYVRQNALNRHDVTYVSYGLNSVFSSVNMLGHMLIDNIQNPSNFDLLGEGLNHCIRYKEWIKARIVESVLMANLGASQEEGTLSGIRKCFMILLALSRHDPVANYSLQDFVDSINECMLDRPYAMYWVAQIRFTCKALLSGHEAKRQKVSWQPL